MDDRDDARRRAADSEEERDFWEAVEADKRLEEERLAAERLAEEKESAIEGMVEWFAAHFEDPQNDTPHDNEDDRYIYLRGGPFEAADVLHAQFGDDHPEDWIQETVDRVQRDGTVEWAPSPHGDFYEHPADDERDRALNTKALSRSVDARLAALEAILPLLPTRPASLGHNAPPDDIGLPPYTDEDASDAAQAVIDVRTEMASATPDPLRLTAAAARFDGIGRKILAYCAKKADLAVDETIKNTIRILTWTEAMRALADAAKALFDLARHLTLP